MFYVYKTCSLISRELTESVQRKPTFLLVSSNVFHCYRLYVLHIALLQKEKIIWKAVTVLNISDMLHFIMIVSVICKSTDFPGYDKEDGTHTLISLL